jgi:type I restriction enzyme S subunit
MIEGLKPYAEYKESGQKWLGGVPAHWELKPGHAAFAPRKESNRGMKEKTVLSLSYGRIKVKATDKQHGLVPESYETYQVVNEGDIIIRGTDLQNDQTSLRIGLSRNRGIISSAYLCLEAQPSITPDYGYQILNVFDITKAIYRFGSGLRQNLDHGEIKRLPIFLPPLDEQAAIVRFLDHANRKIDGFIRAKRKLIGLLNEQKQAIIHRAVTRGLHPDVPLKPSGIPWLGDIPQHWETIRCSGLFREVIDVGHPNARLLSIDRFKGIIPQDETGRKTRASHDRGAYKRVRPGQLAYNLMNAFMGALGFSQYDGIVSPAYAVAQPLQEIETRYFHHLLRTSSYTGEFNRLSYGIMYERNRLYFERFKVVRALLPPLGEQKAIADWIEANTGTLTTAIARTEREIALMQEYRTRLTADLVTGKLDVREAAANLPDLPTDTSATPDEALEELEPDEVEA